MATEDTKLDDELARLKKQKELAELKAQIAALAAPWWKKAGLITTMTALIAAVLPVTKVIEEHYRNRRELALEEAKEQNDLRLTYLARYEVPGQRLRTLRFLIATADDPRLRAWAEAEAKIVQQEVDPIRDEIRALEARLREATDPREREELERQLGVLRALLDVKSLGTAPFVPPRSGGAGGANPGASGAPPSGGAGGAEAGQGPGSGASTGPVRPHDYRQ